MEARKSSNSSSCSRSCSCSGDGRGADSVLVRMVAGLSRLL